MHSKIHDKIEAVKAPMVEQVALLDAIPVEVEAGEKAAYDEGYKAGQESIVLPDPTNPDAQYTQADMDRLAETVRAEKDAEYKVQIDNLNAQISELGTKVGNLENQLVQAGDQAVAAFKAELKAKYDQMQVVESEAETGFGELLK